MKTKRIIDVNNLPKFQMSKFGGSSAQRQSLYDSFSGAAVTSEGLPYIKKCN